MSRNLGIILAALCVALGLGSTVHASTNVLLNVPWTSNPDGLPFGVNNATNQNLNYTDGTTVTWGYQYATGNPGAPNPNTAITYDLGSIVTGLSTVGVATNGAAGSRNNPRFITLNFSNNNFSTIIATDVINLADTMADQDVPFPSVNARYVQFVMPPDNFTGFYNDGFVSTDYVLPAEFELYTPEPASLGLLVIGGGFLLGKRRRRAA